MKGKFSLRLNKNQRKKKNGGQFKSGLEKLVASKMLQAGLGAEYEPDRFKFVKQSHYVPDFKIKENTYIEVKGWFMPSDRSKMVAFKEQYPNITIYLLFGNAKNKLSRVSKTTYGEWATKHGFVWSDIAEGIPATWWQ